MAPTREGGVCVWWHQKRGAVCRSLWRLVACAWCICGIVDMRDRGWVLGGFRSYSFLISLICVCVMRAHMLDSIIWLPDGYRAWRTFHGLVPACPNGDWFLSMNKPCDDKKIRPIM
ncbi:hypothetical protein GUJ93_ZPchr0007g4672 [Zizania palustris]|uniref:Uncharacterized protein n=1 Tax=Zizania palustris TaxID=103762 RepID=A0A8J5W5F4_ZIZPA|nr:hypothetical protein GUJ93_ZPchr0007g4672 [Zizania palustris]